MKKAAEGRFVVLNVFLDRVAFALDVDVRRQPCVCAQRRLQLGGADAVDVRIAQDEEQLLAESGSACFTLSGHDAQRLSLAHLGALYVPHEG